MADTKISGLTGVTTVAGANELAVNEAGTSKKASVTQVATYLGTIGMPRVIKLTGDHAISSTTGTEVTGLSMVLEAGTYFVQYMLVVRSDTATTGPMLGINFTGTANRQSFIFRFADGSTALTAYTRNMDDEGVKDFGVMCSTATRTFTTTAPNLGTTVGVTTINVDIPCIIEGLVVVTASGDLELWHSSETANSTTVMTGSSIIVIRTA